jgi:Leucine-rich repeat (LRR) protein
VIENVNHLTRLVTLNLSNNLIKKVEGLVGLVQLKNLDLAGNLIPNTGECQELLEVPSIRSLDLKNNQMDDHENFVEFFGKMQQLNAIYLNGNPGKRLVTNYRRVMTLALPELNYLEDRPVFDYERLLADAWKKGGREAENIARDEWKAS